MKAIAQHTLFSVICLAGMLLAAPYLSTSRPAIAHATICRPAPVLTQTKVTVSMNRPAQPSLEDGSIRFACW
jgi:hypothetical protein